MEEDDGQQRKIAGVVKWFDGSKGFGFLTDPDGGADILLHANVLRNFGQSSVAEGSHVIAIIQKTPRGMQAVEVLEITPPASEPMPAIADLCSATPEEIAQLPLLPARVKWFDKAKGFGFATSLPTRPTCSCTSRCCAIRALRPGRGRGHRAAGGRWAAGDDGRANPFLGKSRDRGAAVATGGSGRAR